jgi:hypothetical protein
MIERFLARRRREDRLTRFGGSFSEGPVKGTPTFSGTKQVQNATNNTNNRYHEEEPTSKYI